MHSDGLYQPIAFGQAGGLLCLVAQAGVDAVEFLWRQHREMLSMHGLCSAQIGPVGID